MTKTSQHSLGYLNSLPSRAARRLLLRPGAMRGFILSACQTASRSGVLPNHAKRLAVTTLIWIIGWSHLAAKLLPKLEDAMAAFSREEVKQLYADDPWVSNLLLNMWEYIHGETTLTSYPWNISLPIADGATRAALSVRHGWKGGKFWTSSSWNPLLRYYDMQRSWGLSAMGNP